MQTSPLVVAAALAALATPASSADLGGMPAKAVPPAIVSPWDVAFGAAVMSDYMFRGITQSAHKPSIAAYVEPRYSVTPNLQLYAGVSGESVALPNRAAAEIDLYAGVRPALGPVTFDLGFWYYGYPGGQCFNPAVPGPCSANGAVNPVNGNIIKADLSFWEVYAKATYNVTDAFVLGANFDYTPSFLNSGADGVYLSGTAKFSFPTLSGGIGFYVSGELGRQFLGTTDAFYGIPAATPIFVGGVTTGAFAGGIPLPDYTTWNVGIGATWKVFTFDLRYWDTNLSKGDCNAFTGDFTASGPVSSNVTPINPAGFGSKWCGSTFVAKLSADVTLGGLK